tara:strand:- start:364 stop:750 length:387 start_codon:yes stop_codon:yes gene_type:complete
MNGRQPTVSDAIIALGIDGGFKIRDGKIAKWYVDDPQPSDEEIQTKLQELRAAQPLKELREERNRRIALTDWRFRSDLSPSQEWKDYCVALRDLPANYSPTIDIIMEDEYPLVKEDNTTPWPEEPSDG